MNKSVKPDPTTTKPPRNRFMPMALLAGVLGIAAGAGLYALNGFQGNTEVVQTSAGGCSYEPELNAKLDAAATGDVAAFRALDRPYSVETLAFKDKDGQPKTLSQWQGKTVLLNLWATWCAPCREEMPDLDELQAKLGGDKFEVLPVSVDLGDDTKPKKFFEDIGISHMGFYHDAEMTTFNDLKKDGLAFGLPATLLINRQACVLGVLNGPAKWAGEDAQKLVRAAM